MKKSEKAPKASVNPDLFLIHVNNGLYFSVQKAFQERGVTLVDLNTGHLVYGQVNVDTIGMILGIKEDKKDTNTTNTNSFLIPPKKQKKVVDVEATLNIYEPQDPSKPVIFTIQIVNENDLQKWTDIIHQIGCMYVYYDKLENKAIDIQFRTVCLAMPDPNDTTNSAINTMLGNIQRYRANQGENSDLISGFFIHPDFYEDDIDQK